MRLTVFSTLSVWTLLVVARFAVGSTQTSHLLFVSSLSNSKTPTATTILKLLPVSSYDIGVSAFAVTASYAWLQIWIHLAKEGAISPILSRKLIHSGSAPLFMALWPLYSADPNHARFVAALVPALQVIRLTSAGLRKRAITSSSSSLESPIMSTAVDGTIVKARQGDLVNAISRSGDQKEALQGPLIYTIVLLAATMFFFRESSIGVVAVSQMAVGDGVADIVGRRWGTKKWPFSDKKSYAGSLAFVAGAFLSSFILLAYFRYTGSLSLDVLSPELILKLLAISIFCAAVELAPVGDDNYTVPIAGGLAAYLLIEPMISK